MDRLERAREAHGRREERVRARAAKVSAEFPHWSPRRIARELGADARDEARIARVLRRPAPKP